MRDKKTKRGPFITTVQQAKRVIKVVFGFTILLGGCVMILTPGPGVAAIIGGLAILATEFVWARKLMNRFKKEAANAKNSFLNNYINKNSNSKNSRKSVD